MRNVLAKSKKEIWRHTKPENNMSDSIISKN